MTYIRASPATLGFDPPSNRLSLPPAAPIQRNSNDILVALFRKGTDPRTIITLDKPLSFRWKILEKLNEYEDQTPTSHEVDPARISFPARSNWKGSNITPKLLGYKTGTQDRSGLVPAILMALAHFGILKAVKERREQIRVAFLKALAKPKEYGWYPIVNKARSLVWHRETQTLYFIGRFSKTMEGEPRRLAEPAQRIATFELAIPDVPVRWKDWDKYTSRWKW
ncbi:hypothetical protein N7472_005982 [Penicillium cf. griseofulvum]|uniref:Uncharacterized protein n=1 Tax=Penicillium cf. griseofulvum TaxID=2972120 RepID=A0A9W9SVR9_9EURO|nr:hypothetical protein N7472_005982 [Penicillium cf. griseofulvum]